MGKVPAILHGDALVTEQVAIGIYLADLFRKRASRRPLARRCADPICAGSYFMPRALSPRSSIRR
jgi:glutathione S-transferase